MPGSHLAPPVPPSLSGLPCPLAKLNPKVRRKISRKWHQIGHTLAPASLSLEPTTCLLLANAGLHNGVGLSELAEIGAVPGQLDGLTRILQPAGRPYSLAMFARSELAEAAAARLQLRRLPTREKSVTVYAFYVGWPADTGVDEAAAEAALTEPLPGQLPPGLSLTPEAVSPAEEAALLALVDGELAAASDAGAGRLRFRRVLHWGHEFIYGRNRLAHLPDRPLPTLCAGLADRLTPPDLPRPDQLTVNVYEPGGGIPSHVDSHAAFGAALLCVSLGSACTFRFSRPGRSAFSLLLPARSSLLLTAEARLLWAHEMPARRVDLVSPGDLVWRGRRVSFTFRRARPPGEPCRCGHAGFCDEDDDGAGLAATTGSVEALSTCGNVEESHERTAEAFTASMNALSTGNVEALKAVIGDQTSDAVSVDASATTAGTVGSTLAETAVQSPLDAGSLESEYVHSVYDSIAEHFSDTRHSRWPRVAAFLDALPAGCLLLDVGCGNGKNMLGRPDILAIGCDRSAGLCGVCSGRGLPVFQADALCLPVREAAFDAAVCVAVLHHLSTPDRRASALRQLARICRPGAPLLVYVWALEQRRGGRASAYLKEPAAEAPAPLPRDARTGLGVHRPGAEFAAPDLLVPWRSRGGGATEERLRFYHLFEEGELDRMCADSGLFDVVEAYYDNGNWCVRLLRNDAPV